jgi:hypothetical protein
VVGDGYIESDGQVLLGSALADMDAETDVVGEAKYRDLLVRLIDLADEAGDVDDEDGRAVVPFSLEAGEYRLAVLCAGHPVGYVEDGAAAEWLPRVRDWQARGVEVMCYGAILWDARLGDPRDDESVPVGCRLDLVDQG